MFKINPARPWPPEIDFASLRAQLTRLRDDTSCVPSLAGVEQALAEALTELDEAQAVEASTRLPAGRSIDPVWQRRLR